MQFSVCPFKRPVGTNGLSNYRPISVLPVFSKVFEKVTYPQLCDYLENNSNLHKLQCGFRAKKSTTQAILHFLQYLYRHIDSGNVVFSLFLGFRNWHLIVLTMRFCYQS